MQLFALKIISSFVNTLLVSPNDFVVPEINNCVHKLVLVNAQICLQSHTSPNKAFYVMLITVAFVVTYSQRSFLVHTEFSR